MIEKVEETTPVKLRKLKLHLTEVEDALKKTQQKFLAMSETVIQLHGIMMTQVACTDLLIEKEIVTLEEIGSHLQKVIENDKNRDQKDS